MQQELLMIKLSRQHASWQICETSVHLIKYMLNILHPNRQEAALQ